MVLVLVSAGWLAGCAPAAVPEGSTGVVISEVMPSNDTTHTDPVGEYDDWVEIYNAGDTAVDLGGYFVSDDELDRRKHQLPAGLVVAAGGALTLWADGQIEQGPDHLPFSLRAAGETVSLSARDGSLIDALAYTDAEADFSFARHPGSMGPFILCGSPTPGAANGEACGLDGPSGGAVDSGTLVPLGQHAVTQIAGPSGLTYANHRLYAVGDESEVVYALSGDGAHVGAQRLDLRTREQDSLEAVAVDGQTVMVADEANGQVIRASLSDGHVLDRLSLPELVDGNRGIEGLVALADGGLLVAKEDGPPLLVRIGPDGRELERLPLSFASDISGIAPACDGEVFALSQEDRAVFRLTLDGRLLDRWPVPLDRPEGIAFDGGRTVYVVDESDGTLLVLDWREGCAAVPGGTGGSES